MDQTVKEKNREYARKHLAKIRGENNGEKYKEKLRRDRENYVKKKQDVFFEKTKEYIMFFDDEQKKELIKILTC